ncbi:MAG: cyclic nucleotide-binding domain-containing protein, partial [Chloroflexi bacterium]|nr:cyclic nucleotide-binding domain-containing protein [Chloroflexota bacterium]
MANSVYFVNTAAGSVLVHSPPETLKYLLAEGLKPPKIFLLPTDMPAGQQLGSSGFIRQGINYASVEFLMYANFFGSGQKTQIITTTADQARRIRRYLDETIVGPENSAYGDYLWLQRECAAVGYYPPLNRELQTDDLITITSLETGGGKLESDVEISLENDHFVFSENGKVVAKISTTISGISTPLSLAPPRPLHRQEITLQFIGGSDGFDPAGITTCFLAYLGSSVQTQATLFDTAAYLRLRLGNLGISPSQISEVVLSHLHEDHLAGLPELLLMGDHRVRLLTSDIIYESLLRVLCALMAIPEKEVNKRFESLYAVHSIPTISVRANSLYYSGDMRYDEEWFEELVKEEILTAKRRDELIHFADGASVLVQDVGGGAIHTTLTPALLKLLASKGQRLVLAHTSKQRLPTGALADYSDKVEFAVSGHVTAVGYDVHFESDAGDVERVETLSACPLFARLSVSERIELADKCEIVNWQDGDVIMRHGDASDGKTYVIHSGLVNITSQDGKSLRTIGRGNSVGERGALQG